VSELVQVKSDLEYLIELAISRLNATFGQEDNTIILTPRLERPIAKLTITITENGYKVLRIIYEDDVLQLNYDDRTKTVTIDLSMRTKIAISYSDPDMELILSRNDLAFFSLAPVTAIVSFFTRLLPNDMKIAGMLYSIASETDRMIYKQQNEQK